MEASTVFFLTVFLCRGIFGYNEKGSFQKDELYMEYDGLYSEEDDSGIASRHTELTGDDSSAHRNDLSYSEEELASFLEPGHNQHLTTESLIAKERFCEFDSIYYDGYNGDTSYTQQELDSLCSSTCSTSKSYQTTAATIQDVNKSYNEEGLAFLKEPLRQKHPTTDSIIVDELACKHDRVCGDYDGDMSYTQEELDSLYFVTSGSYQMTAATVQKCNKSYTEDDLAFLLEPGLKQCYATDSINDAVHSYDYNCDKSYTAQELDSICSYSSECTQITAELNEKRVRNSAFGNQFDCSTPIKKNRQKYTSFQEEWGSYLQQTRNEDEEMLPTSESDTDENDFESDSFNFMSVDPEFYGNVYAAPKKCTILKGVSPSRESSLLKKALDKKSILQCKKVNCKCGSNCMNIVTVRDIYSMRERFWTKSRHSQSQYLTHTMAIKTVKGRFTYLMLDNGRKVCKKAFGYILKIDKKRFTSVKKLAEKGAKAEADKKPRSVSSSTVSALAWLQTYATERGDRMPHSTDVLLPYKTTKVSVYNAYKLECDNHPCGRSQFFQLWKDHFPHLKIKEVNSFSVCSKCAWFVKRLERKLKPWKREKIRKERQLHLERQKLERLHYYSKRDKSRSDPDHFLSLIIDGMDQSKSSLPHFTGRQAKNINLGDLLKTHITGVINHGQRRFETFVDYNQWAHDPNLTINILFLALQKAILSDNKLPGTLYLQADNCWRENKNKYVLAICELLVREKVFHEVQLSFLFVGHTHEDVDAAFSQISKQLKQKDLETYDEFMQFLPSSMNINTMFDVKSWLEPHLCEPLSHTEPLHFKFQSFNDDVKVHYKGLYSQPWIEYEWGFFKSYTDGKKYLPRGEPKLLKPNMDNINIERIKRQIHSIKHMFSKQEHFEWWNSFLNKISNIDTNQRTQWYLKSLPRQMNEKEKEHTEDCLPPELRKLLDKETRVPQMKVVKKSTTVQRNTKRSDRKKQSRSQKKKNKRVVSQSKGNRKRSHVRGRTVCYFLNYYEEKKHIWFQILCDFFSNLVLAYGISMTLIRLYQQLVTGCVVIHIIQLFLILDAFTQWLNYQLYCQAIVDLAFCLPNIFIPLTELKTISLKPHRNKELCS